MAEQVRKILIVEDERPIANALKLKLENCGYAVEIALNGEEALDYIAKDGIDLILLDLIMPKMNGFDFLDQMKDKGIHIPVIVASNLSQEEDIKKTKDLGVVDYFVKSNTPIVEIVDKIKDILG